MALDGAFLSLVRQELMILQGGRVDKIHQPSREELIISFRTRDGARKLLISVSANSARIHLTNEAFDNPQAPPMFCMLMRKHLSAGKLMDIRQDGFERILYLDFEAANEMGDIVNITLAVEIMGKYSNLIIIGNEGRILDALKRVDAEMSRERLVLPGMKYALPPRTERLSFVTAANEQIRSALSEGKSMELSKKAVQVFEGISPVLAREWAFFASRGEERVSGELDDELLTRFCFAVSKTAAEYKGKDVKYTVIKEKDGAMKDFCFVPIRQYGSLMITSECESACALLDTFYRERDSFARMKQRSGDIYRLLVNLTERISHKLDLQTAELKECANKDGLRLNGDLISANIYRMSKGEESVTLENFYADGCPSVEIKLDKRLTPAENAQKYFSEYKKSVTAERMLTQLIAKGREELDYIDSIFDALTRSTTENEIAQIREELVAAGYLKPQRSKAKPPKPLPPIEYVTADGFTVLVGRNNVQNDRLTLKTAEKDDIWLHVKNITGSHTVIQCGGKQPPDSTILEAARIAAFHSRARQSAQVPVDYVPVRFVKKPTGAKPGMVIFTNNHTVYVKPRTDGEDTSDEQG